MMLFFEKIKKRFNVKSNWQFLCIMVVFSITGFIAVLIVSPLLSLINLNKETTSAFIYWPLRILIIFPAYQILLIIIGTLFGQFNFFWKFEKKMLSRIGFKRFFTDK